MTRVAGTELNDEMRKLAREAVRLGLTWADLDEAWRREVLLALLEAERGHAGRTASRMGMHRNTLNRLMRELGVRVALARRQGRHPLRVIETVTEPDRPGRQMGEVLWTANGR